MGYAGEIGINVKGHIKMSSKTNVANIIIPYVDKKFYEITDKCKKIKRLGIEFGNVVDKSFESSIRHHQWLLGWSISLYGRC